MFRGFPEDPAQHPFVTSGDLTDWVMQQELCDLAEDEEEWPVHSESLFRKFFAQILGRDCDMKRLPDYYYSGVYELLLTAISAAVERKSIILERDDSKPLPYTGGHFLSKDHREKLEFPADLQFVLQRGFMRAGAIAFGGPDEFKLRMVFRHLNDRQHGANEHCEHRMRIMLGTGSRLHGTIARLYPFIWDYHRGKGEMCPYPNPLGRKLWSAIRREYFWEPKRKSRAELDANKKSKLTSRQMLVLISCFRIARPDPIDSLVFSSAASLFTGAPVYHRSSFIWRAIVSRVEETLSQDLKTLVEEKYVQYRDRDSGEVNNHSTPHWIELTKRGYWELRHCYLVTNLIEQGRKELFKRIVMKFQFSRKSQFREALLFAIERDAKSQSWTEKDLRSGLNTTASKQALISDLYPIIEFDPSHFGVGARYRLSAFGKEFVTATTEDKWVSTRLTV